MYFHKLLLLLVHKLFQIIYKLLLVIHKLLLLGSLIGAKSRGPARPLPALKKHKKIIVNQKGPVQIQLR